MTEIEYGPKTPLAIELDEMKYRLKGETFKESRTRVANALKDSDEHYHDFRDSLLGQYFLPGGRVLSAVGAPREVTPFNCFVSMTIEDSMDSIMDAAKYAATTMRLGGGIGYDFSNIRPRGTNIVTLDSRASGPVSFMGIFDAICKTISSAGHRRGAQMGCLRVDHPDIEEFISCKSDNTTLTQFNLSVLVTDEFMKAVDNNSMFQLRFEGRVYKQVRARYLWEKIMRQTWDYAEPGVIFVDRINRKNNLWYCETIAATNPCLHPDSLIETIHGRVKIKDITEPTMVYTMMEDGSLGIKKASASWVSKKNANTLKVKIRSGKEVVCTPDHKIYVSGKGWVEARDLKVGDKLVQLCRARRGAAYSGVKLSTEDNRAYQMEHRLIAAAVYGKLSDSDDVHHIDGNTYNNCIDNFEVIDHSEHATLTRYECDNDHMVNGYNETYGRNCFISPEWSMRGRKSIVPMPEELRSNMRNQNSSCVVSISDGPVTDVYDLTVEDTHNFISDFIVVHNCGEQPLAPHAACLLGSMNLTKFVKVNDDGKRYFDYEDFKRRIPAIVRAMDNINDIAIYPLPEQKESAQSKRRMGLGVTGLANAGEVIGLRYGSDEFMLWAREVFTIYRDECYRQSIQLAKEKGPFPLFDAELYLQSEFAQTLPDDIRSDIARYGIRNSHLLSIAPTGTISNVADNVSSGIEPPFSLYYDRVVQTFDGPKTERVSDYAYRVWGVEGVTALEIDVQAHVDVLCLASEFVDSACSKTINVGDDVTWEQFQAVYVSAYEGGASGCTTFRADGKRAGILTAAASEDVAEPAEGGSCVYDPVTGIKSCE